MEEELKKAEEVEKKAKLANRNQNILITVLTGMSALFWVPSLITGILDIIKRFTTSDLPLKGGNLFFINYGILIASIIIPVIVVLKFYINTKKADREFKKAEEQHQNSSSTFKSDLVIEDKNKNSSNISA